MPGSHRPDSPVSADRRQGDFAPRRNRVGAPPPGDRRSAPHPDRGPPPARRPMPADRQCRIAPSPRPAASLPPHPCCGQPERAGGPDAAMTQDCPVLAPMRVPAPILHRPAPRSRSGSSPVSREKTDCPGPAQSPCQSAPPPAPNPPDGTRSGRAETGPAHRPAPPPAIARRSHPLRRSVPIPQGRLPPESAWPYRSCARLYQGLAARARTAYIAMDETPIPASLANIGAGAERHRRPDGRVRVDQPAGAGAIRRRGMVEGNRRGAGQPYHRRSDARWRNAEEHRPGRATHFAYRGSLYAIGTAPGPHRARGFFQRPGPRPVARRRPDLTGPDAAAARRARRRRGPDRRDRWLSHCRGYRRRPGDNRRRPRRGGIRRWRRRYPRRCDDCGGRRPHQGTPASDTIRRRDAWPLYRGRRRHIGAVGQREGVARRRANHRRRARP